MAQIKRLFVFVLFACISFSLFGCKKKGDDVIVLRVYNWEDYIDEGLEDVP